MTDQNQSADVSTEGGQVTEGPHGTEEQHATDWKAEARKWEARAKENKAAADELEALKQSQLTEQQKAEQRAEKAEEELAQLRAEKQHETDVTEVAKDTGAPAALLECCSDRDAMGKLAAAYNAIASEHTNQGTKAAPTARQTRIVRDKSAAPTTADIFADFVNQTFGK